MDFVTEVLEKAAKKAESYKPTNVEKELDLEFDLGTLLACDTNFVNEDELRNNKASYLLNLARDDTQLLINKLWELPMRYVDEAFVAKIPAQTYVLPRQLPVPKVKPMTRWQQFASEKGINKTKQNKTLKTWDEALQKWVPKFGYKHSEAEREKNWIIEYKETDDSTLDKFEQIETKKKEKIAKNEFHRLRNIAAAHNIKVPKSGFATKPVQDAKFINTQLNIAKLSTASVGKFQEKLRHEKPVKVSHLLPYKKKKRQIGTLEEEKKHNLKILDGLMRKKPILDVTKAVNHQFNTEEQRRREEKKQNKPKGKKKKGHKVKKGSSRRSKLGKKGGSKKRK